MSRLTRSLASRPEVSRPAYIAGTARYLTNTASSVGRQEHGEKEDNNRHFTMIHRPISSPVPSRNRIVPLMQTFNFRTSAPKEARLDVSTIDFAVMPSLAAEAAGDFALRVPLLPDNYAPDRQNLDGHAPEVADGPLASPQIVVVAGHPENVVAASALTEIEGMGIDGVELQFAHLPLAGGAETSATSGDGSSRGMIRDLWKGLLEDLSTSPVTTLKST
ncbi:hypothetical protein SEPCBS119000_006655 [Sporothrix epigloea]|uniref:Uncharacterized protein n=1 Tax=Sporothrix epigloea TaxID=1892477 RepID=A0ABP0E8G1_9PEZI